MKMFELQWPKGKTDTANSELRKSKSHKKCHPILKDRVKVCKNSVTEDKNKSHLKAYRIRPSFIYPLCHNSNSN